MLAYTEGRSEKRWDGFVGMIAVINAMVVFLYWRLFLADPASVTRNGELGEPYLELYLHGLGPLLQWIDALFIHKSFNKLRRSLVWLISVIGAYVLWAELVVQSLSTSPVGRVTNGLPYPFLNNLEFEDRAMFYGINFATAVLLLFAFAAIAGLVRRQSRVRAAI